MKKVIIFLIIISSLFLISIVFQENYNIIRFNDKNNDKTINTPNIPPINSDLGNKSANHSTTQEDSQESENPQNTNISLPNSSIPPQLPSDINTTECGYYFSQYQICSGTCPSGTCVNEGRSCYCKN